MAAVSTNSHLAFKTNSTLQAKHHHVSRSSIGASTPKATHFKSYWDRFGLRIHIKERRCSCLSVADSNRLGTDDKGPEGIERSISDDQESALNPSSVGGIAKPQASPDDKLESQISETSNGSMGSAVGKQERRPNLQSIAKKSPLTARERLKAARVLSRYAESKPSKKSEMGSKVLAALRESDRGNKTSGLPEAPTNMFDDNQRGLSQGAWNFQFPGSSDLLVIVFSFVFISTVMFATTYVVWKVGAIHFNEY